MRVKLYKKTPFVFFRKRRSKFPLLILAIVIFSLILLYYFFERIYPNYMNRAKSYAENLALKTLNQSINEVIDTNCFSHPFSEIVNTSEGSTASLTVDTMLINKFKSEIIKTLQKNIDNLSEGYIHIPLGSLSEKEIFSGIGPKLKIKIIPVGVAIIDFSEEFISCGINQVKHSISLDAEVKIRIISATMFEDVSVKTTIPVSETVFSGTVPNYYGNGLSIAAGSNRTN